MKKPISFGKYLLLDRINVGGMAEVFSAKVFGEDGSSQILAIKKILPTMVEDEEFISMFIDEARIAVQLDHRNVVQIFELGKYEENYYIAMEYLPGRDLRALLDRAKKRKEPVAIEQSLFIASELAHGLDYAHRAKDQQGVDLDIVHRDVSPQNILISYDGQIKLIDFGIAKAATRNQQTQVGILKGKFGYMSPEQVRGLPIDRRSDIFALGVILYEMLTGERLFVGESDFSILERVRNAEVPPPRKYNAGISPELERIVLKALAREADERYQWASELRDDLLGFLGHEAPGQGEEPLAGFMRQAFGDELLRDRERMQRFADVGRPDEVPITSLRSFQGTRPGLHAVAVRAEATRSLLASTEAQSGEFESPETGPMPNPGEQSYPVSDQAGATVLHIQGLASPPALERVGPPSKSPETTSTTDSGGVLAGPPPLPRAARVVPGRGLKASRWAMGVLVVLLLLLGGVTVHRLLFPTGSLVITAHASGGVEVEVDASVVPVDGDGLFVVHGLHPGSHLVVLKAASGSRVLKVSVTPNQLTPVEITLPVPTPNPPPLNPTETLDAGLPSRPVQPPIPAMDLSETAPAPSLIELTIETDPPGADLSIDKAPVGQSPFVFKAERGRAYVIRSRLAGYQPTVRRLRVSETQTMTLALTPVAAASASVAKHAVDPAPPPREHEHHHSVAMGLLVIGSSQSALVFVDGKSTGRYTPVAPANPIELPSGPHVIHLQSDDGKHADARITVKAHEVNKLTGIELL